MKKIYFLAFALLFHLLSFGQSISIGTGTVTNSSSPWNPYYGYSYVQTLYKASEINAAGNITSITFDFAGTSLAASDSIVVYMGNTSKNAFASSTDWVPVGSMTEVFNGVLTGLTLPGPITITLTTPFAYNGASNLVIAVDENRANFDDPINFNATSMPTSNRVLYYRNDNTNADPATPPSGTLSSTFANIIIDGLAPASCQGVSGVTVTNITATTATAAWSAPSGGNTPTGYQWEVRTSGAPGSGATGLAANGNSTTTDANITGLVSSTLDTFYVRSECGAGVFAPWSTGVPFATLCGATNIPYSLNFEGTTNLPLCTITENVGTGNNWIIVNNPGNGFTTNTLRYAYNTTNPADTWFFTQGLNLTAGVSYRVAFNYGNNNVGYTESLEVKYGTDQNAASMSDLVVDYPSINAAAPANSVTDFTPSSTGVYYFGFHAYSIANQWNLYVDDIKFTLTPTCDVPTKLVVSNITTTSVQIDWLAPTIGTPTAYDLYYSTSNVAPTATTTPSVSAISGITKNVTGLSPNTKYYYYLRTVCGTSGSSPWTAIDSFTTSCVSANSFNENFDGVIAPNLPSCWSKILRGSTLATAATITTLTTTGNVYSTPNSVGLYNSSSTATDDIILVSPPLSNVGAGTYQLTFYAKNSSLTQDIEVGTLDNNSAITATFTPLQTVDISATFQKYTVDFSSYSGADQYIGIRAVNATTFSYVYLDNIVWELIPNCSEPTAKIVSNISASGADINWTAPTSGSPTGYDLYYSTVRTAPIATTTPIVAGIASTSASVTSLTSATKYYYFLRTVCGTSGKSNWTSIDSFTTICSAVSTFSENFDGVTATALPICWSKVGAGGLANTQIANPNSAPNTLYIYSSTATSQAMVSLPPVTSASTSTNWLKFNARGNFTAGGIIEVGYLTDPTDPATFTLISPITASTLTYQSFTVTPGAIAGTDIVLAFRHTGTPAYSVLIDDVKWEIPPTCVEPNTIIASNITGTDAQIDWTAPTSGSPSSYDVYYSTTNTAPTATTTPSTSGISSTTANLTSLSASSTYYVWVRSNCGTGGFSSWTPAYTFNTACGVITAPTSAPETFVTAVIPPNCWSRAKGTLASPTTFTSTTTSNWALDDYLNATTPVNKCAKINIYGTAIIDWLITPSYELGTGGNFQLEFDLGLTNWNGTAATTLGVDDKFYVVVSTDNGVTWDSVNTIRRWNATTPISNTGEHIVISLAAYTGSVKFAFYGESTVSNADNDLFVDNVELKPLIIFPVQLMSFVGEKVNNLNQLSWITSTEVGNKGFEIQRSLDGVHFNYIGFATSKSLNGNSSVNLSYRFIDEKTPNVTTYYRLKQINLDGISKLSNLVTIKGIKTAEVTFSSIYPNPVKRDLNIVISSPQSEKLTLVITDLAGKAILRKVTNVINGDNQISLNVESLTSGTYIIKSLCANGCENAVQKFVKQ